MSSIAQKIAKRVAERDSWSTYRSPTPGEVCKLFCGDARGVVANALPEGDLDKEFPIANVQWGQLRNPPPDKIQSTWIGHATMFVQMGGWNIITDPVFSERCSAVQFAGPKRYRRAACTIKELCVTEANIGVDVVLVSHNHYDHLDYNSVKELAATAITMKRPVNFVVALGLKAWFERHVPDCKKGGNQITELDWHESMKIEGNDDKSPLEVTGIPMQHWSNRNMFDKDKSLWCGFGVKTMGDSPQNFLFSGDTGFFEGLYKIGEDYGPFDFAGIPIGAYEPRWFMQYAHMNPEDAVKMMEAVQAKRAFPIHWGTFMLTIEPVLEPRDRLEDAMDDANKDKSTFAATLIGETVIA